MLRHIRSAIIFTLALLGAAAILVALPSSVDAHHSYVTKYDPKKTATIKGVVETVSFQNPHMFFTVTVASKSGGSATWKVETESIAKVRAKGLSKKWLKPGARVTVTGWWARDKSAQIGLATIKFKGGPFLKVRSTPR